MLENPSHRVIQALASLESNADFQVVLEYLQGSLNEIDRYARYLSDEVHTRWHQGASQVLGEFLEKAHKARETARKF